MSTLADLLTPLIAAIAVYIAYQQWRTNDLKVRIDLFDRRLEVHEAAADIMFEAISQGDLTWDQLRSFSMKAKNAQFLFSDRVEQFLRDMADKGEALIRANEKYRKSADMGLGNTTYIEPMIVEAQKAADWFKAQSPNLKALFKAEMRLN